MTINFLNPSPWREVKNFFNQNLNLIGDQARFKGLIERPLIDIENQQIKSETSLSSRAIRYIRAHPLKTAFAVVCVAASCALLYAYCVKDTNPIQPENSESFFVFSSYTTDNPDRLNLSRKVAENHKWYCTAHGYDYQVFEENLAASSDPNQHALPYWSKIAGFKKLLSDPKLSRKKWFVWLDDDMVITNSKIKLEDLTKKIAEKIELVVTEDPFYSLNTGFMLLKNDDKSRSLIQELWNMRFEIINKSSGHSYANCPNQSCLHEQQALKDILEITNYWKPYVQIIPQRFLDGVGINTFLRGSHFDVVRNMFFNYDEDPAISRWNFGDFMAQCTGLATKGRLPDSKEIVNLREHCIDYLIAQVK